MENNARAYLASAGAFVPHWLLTRAEISHGAKLTYARLAQNVDDRGVVRANPAKLAAYIGSEVRQVMRFLIELEKRSLIEIQSPPAEACPLCCLLPDHPWMDRSELGATNGTRDPGTPKGQSKSRGRSRGSDSHLRADKFGRSESETRGNGKPNGRRVSQPLSRFTYEACLEHAIRKQKAGEPIRSVGGLANHFYWTGEQDEEIARRLGSDDARGV